MESCNKPVDVEVIATATLQKEKRDKKIKDSASTVDTEGKWRICIKHRNGTNGCKFTWSRQAVSKQWHSEGGE